MAELNVEEEAGRSRDQTVKKETHMYHSSMILCP